MKKLSIILLTLVCYSVHAQKWHNEWGLSYAYSNPSGAMGNIIQQGHGGNVHYGWVNPAGRFAVGLDLSLSLYGHDKSRQEYEMSDGSFAPMDVVVSNTYLNIMVYTRWYLATQGPLRPYLVGKLGYTRFNTDLNIYDPDDRDHCEPVDHDVLYNDGTFVAAAGAGVKIDLASVFNKLQKAKFYFDTNINFVQGGNVRYMNADADPGHHKPAPDVGHVTAEFINTQTQIVHEHHVGHLYQSAVQMTEIRVGFSMNISR
jgi:hypothetical protein